MVLEINVDGNHVILLRLSALGQEKNITERLTRWLQPPPPPGAALVTMTLITWV